jgi:hypothetical protein
MESSTCAASVWISMGISMFTLPIDSWIAGAMAAWGTAVRISKFSAAPSGPSAIGRNTVG